MKSDTFWMILKGIGVVGGAVASAYNSGIAQWANEGSWPSTINWHAIISSTCATAFIALVGFSSGAVSEWTRARKNGNTTTDITPKP